LLIGYRTALNHRALKTNKCQFFNDCIHHRYHRDAAENCNCGMEFKDTITRLRHMKLYHRSTGQDYLQCPLCQDVFTKEHLPRHQSVVHKECVCEQCGKVCQSSSQMSSHRTASHGTFRYGCKMSQLDFGSFSPLFCDPEWLYLLRLCILYMVSRNYCPK
jgi:uncharacterized C2H2 Zn-finger protein